MKRIVLMLVAIFAMTIVASATNYTGTVTNVVMNGSPKDDKQNITFTLDDNVLSGNFSIATAHTLDLSADVTFTDTNFDGEGSGRIVMAFIPIRFTCTVDGSQEGDTLTFDCIATTSTGMVCSFTFTGTAK